MIRYGQCRQDFHFVVIERKKKCKSGSGKDRLILNKIRRNGNTGNSNAERFSFEMEKLDTT